MEKWRSVKDELPNDGVTVLAVKELKSGRRDICLAHCIREYEYYDYTEKKQKKEPYWCCGGNNNILYWMPLPTFPEVEPDT